jgi:uncharacterized protein (TIGR03000 family)
MSCYGAWSAPMIMPPVKPEGVGAPKDKDEVRAAPDRAKLIVALPADAKLFIDDQLMKTTSEKRAFNTPTLDKSQTYYYDLRVEVMRDGKPITDTKRVLVRAGEVIRADFGTMDTVATAKAP